MTASDHPPAIFSAIPSMSLLNAMARYSGMSMIAVDRNAHITAVVGKSNRGVHFDAKTAIGQPIDAYFSGVNNHANLFHLALKHQPQKVMFCSESGDYFETQIIPLFDEQNTICGALSFDSDVTEWERAVLDQEEKLEHLFASIQDGIFIIDRDYTITKTNPTFEQMYSEHLPLVGKKCYVTSNLDQICEGCPATTMFETGKAVTLVHYEHPTENKPGMWLEHSTHPHRSPTGEVGAAICFIRDITQRKNDEDALKHYRENLEEMVDERTRDLEQSETKMRVILTGGNIPVVFANCDGTISFANSAFQAMTGYSEQELLGGLLGDFLYDEQTKTDSRFQQARTKFYAEETDQLRQDIVIRLKNGEFRWVDFTASAVRDSGGKRIQIICILQDVSERYQTMEKANELARIMLDTTPLGCVLVDIDRNVLDCNTEAQKLFGIQSKQEFCSHFFELSPMFQPDGRLTADRFIEVVTDVFDTGFKCFEWMHQKLDGTPIPCEITAVRIKRDNKYIAVCYTRDLREYKRMLAEKREADERAAIMLDMTPMACTLFDKNGKTIDCNQEAVRMSMYKDKQEFCERFFELTPEFQPNGQSSVEMRREKFLAAAQTGYQRYEWLYRKTDGTLFPCEITLVRVKQEKDFIIAAYGRDLRDIKKHEAEMARDQMRTNALLELAQMTQRSELEITDYVIKSVISLTDSMMGYAVQLEHAKDTLPFRSMILDQSISCALPTMTEHGTPHTLSSVLTECLVTKKAVIHEDIKALPGKRVFPEGHYEVRSHLNIPIMDGDKPIGILGVGNKTTPYTETDAKQLTLLAQGVRNLWNRQKNAESLERAKNEAESANKAKSEFLAHMSHEIRTPLNGVIGLSDLLAGTPLNEKQKEYVQLINSSGNALLFLINDILDFSKIEAGKLEIELEPFDLSATIGSVIASLVSRTSGKNLELAVSLSQNLPQIVRGDSGRIRQVLLNLASNAVKFTERGGVRIDVTVESVSETFITVKFSVIDTGIGIPQSRIDRLFKAFSQIDASTARVYGGTGLGLAISMKLVRLMKGEIGVESREGKGSMFWFSIPFECDPQVIQCLRNDKCDEEMMLHCSNIDGPYCTAFVNRGISGEYSVKGCGVLVVDDNEIQRDALRIQLENWGMECVTCVSSDEALRLSDERIKDGNPFDLYIIDSTLTDGVGVDLACRLLQKHKREKQEKTKTTQMILLRSLAEDFDLDALDGFSVESIGKPVFASALFNAVMNRIFAARKQKDIDSNSLDPNAPQGVEPARLKARERTAPAKQPRNLSTLSRSQMAGMIHVLVVEDNRVNQIVAKNILAEAGFTCDIANNGIEACAAVRNKQYDVVLMDCQMPEMDGYEATDMIRNWEREQGKKRLPIIALTANATKDAVQQCFDAGMDAYCSKPINSQMVIHQIEEWAKKRN